MGSKRSSEARKGTGQFESGGWRLRFEKISPNVQMQYTSLLEEKNTFGGQCSQEQGDHRREKAGGSKKWGLLMKVQKSGAGKKK